MTKTPVDASQAYTAVAAELPIVKDSTTSRVLCNNDLLRVVQFTFDAGQLLTSHSTPRAVVVQLLEGEMDFTIESDTSHLRAGDCIYLAPGAEHALTAITQCRMSLVMIDVEEVPGEHSALA